MQCKQVEMIKLIDQHFVKENVLHITEYLKIKVKALEIDNKKYHDD